MDDIHLGKIKRRLAGLKCPACGADATGGTSIDLAFPKDMPKPGDYAMCAYCGLWLRYESDVSATSGFRLRPLSAAEFAELRRDPRMSRIMDIAAQGRGLWRRSRRNDHAGTG